MINGASKIALVLGAVVAFGGVGCGSDKPDWEPSDPDEQVAAVKEGLTKPTGTVSASTVKDVLASYGDLAKASDMLNSALSVSGSGLAACGDGDASGGTIDLDCATGGKVTGSIDVSIDGEVSGSNVDATMEMEMDACKGDLCIQASVVTKMSTSAENVSMTIAYSADITEGEKTSHLFFGMDAQTSSSVSSAKIAMWDAKGKSYAFNATASAEGSSFTISGANGEFSCTSTAEGGSCTGATEFQF